MIHPLIAVIGIIALFALVVKIVNTRMTRKSDIEDYEYRSEVLSGILNDIKCEALKHKNKPKHKNKMSHDYNLNMYGRL